METIGQSQLRSFLTPTSKGIITEDDDPCRVTCSQVRKDPGVNVNDYLDLAQKVATIQHYNPDYIFLYRGQDSDYLRKKATTLKPAIFRDIRGNPAGSQGLPSRGVLEMRFDILQKAESALVTHYPHSDGRKRLQRQRILRWAILQHYEICATPLLDVTHSLRIAASFATLGAETDAYIYLLGLPNLGAAITASAEAGLQIVRLSTACPPEAQRPHLQEGYLLGEYPDVPDVSQKEHYGSYEIDFGRRLVAKFRFDPKAFWLSSGPYQPFSKNALYPENDEALIELSKKIREMLPQGQ